MRSMNKPQKYLFKGVKKIIGLFYLASLPMVSWAAEGTINLDNPLTAESVPALINTIIKAILGIVGAIALLYLVLGGLTWLTSQGNSDKVKKGRETLIWAIFGLAMIFFSYAILDYVFDNFLS